jgi:hypothetical protein
MPLNSWLFTRSDKSIYIVRPHQGPSLTIYGPDRSRHDETFSDESAMQQYQMSVAESLAAAGWISYEMNYERRIGDRRKAARNTADRRRG